MEEAKKNGVSGFQIRHHRMHFQWPHTQNVLAHVPVVGNGKKDSK